MKQFQKYGVAAAVTAVSASALAASSGMERSDQNLGDAAIIPYYTTTGGKVTGVHIINTTDATQVVKFRMRRQKDSRDAMDFNIIMSPKDEWVTSIQTNASPSEGKGGVKLITDDTTCTAPVFDADGTLAEIPATYAEGAEEGYIEIIGMGQPTSETAAIAVSALHGKAAGAAPADCASVEYNFLRVTDAELAAGVTAGKAAVGTHDSETTNQGAKGTATTSSSYVTTYGDTPDRALKVSWFIRDADGGLEVGGNAVHIEGFATDAMMTNQEQLVFNADGLMEYDPFNFELPNLNQGSYPASGSRVDNFSAPSALLFNKVRNVLGVDAIHNEWSDKTTDTSTVDTDWVVTLPGQYLSEDPFCVIYAGYPVDGKSCSAAATALSNTEIPLYLVKDSASQFALYDREETVLVDKAETPPAGLDFSPSNTETAAAVSATIPYEVNVLAIGRTDDEAGVLESANAQTFTLPTAADDVDNGWMSLTITPKGNGNQFYVTGNGTTSSTATETGVPIRGNGLTGSYGDWNPASGDTVVLGMAVWKREFGNNAAAAYGRAVEHSYTLSSGRTNQVANYESNPASN
jgi:hypothetical protein